MNVKIPEEMKNILTYNEYSAAKDIQKQMKEYDVKPDLSTLAHFFGSEAPDKCTVEIAKNCKVYEQYGAGTGCLDVWITVTLPETYSAELNKCVIFKVGAYLSDIWQIGGEDESELKSRMYIRKFVEI